MNLLGEGFPNQIIDQVTQRQKVYGSGYSTARTPEEIIFLNSNTSWCKLVSSVDIDDMSIVQSPTLKNISGINGNNLAKQFVLFNGVKNEDSYEQRAGIDLTNDIFGQNKAYGIGGTDFGIRPMMGIKSAEIQNENRGSLRRATVNIKVWNKIQFDIIDLLYLRLGFFVLLEWGHSIYIDNTGNLITNADNSLANDFLEGKNLHPSSFQSGVENPLTYDNFLKLIDYQRKNTSGNYDAMFAKVVNFHWSFLRDGSYDIILNLVSAGDVIESFKINSLVNGSISGSNEDLDKIPDEQLIALYSNKNSIGQYFSNLIKDFPKDTSHPKESQYFQTQGFK